MPALNATNRKEARANMPTYTGLVKDKALKYTRPDLVSKWIERNDGQWFRMKLELVCKNIDSKTAEQLGLYWGLLVPEITEELNVQENTITIEAYGISSERKYVDLDTHELLTERCGRIGEDGASLRLSEMDLTQARMFIDNVKDFAVGSLGMNGERLEAWDKRSSA